MDGGAARRGETLGVGDLVGSGAEDQARHQQADDGPRERLGRGLRPQGEDQPADDGDGPEGMDHVDQVRDHGPSRFSLVPPPLKEGAGSQGFTSGDRLKTT